MGVLKLKTGGAYVDISNIVGDHNYLDGLQGGSASEYYHLSLTRYNALQATGSPTFVTVTHTGNVVLPATRVENQTFGVYEGVTNLIRTFRPTDGVGYNIFIGNAGNNTMSPGGGASYLASYNIAIGNGVLDAITTGNQNVGLGVDALTNATTGSGNMAIGVSSLLTNIVGDANTAVGSNALYSATGGYNTAIGSGAGFTNSTGAQNVFIGYCAGYYETGSAKLFIDYTPRASEADGRLKSLVYGVFAAATVNQYLTVNGNLTATNAFGCNGAAAQTAYVSGGAVVPGAGAFGFSSAANAAALATLVTNIRLALVANGIMS